MKKFYIISQTLLILMFSFIAVSITIGTPNLYAATEKEELVFLNWDDYIDPDLLKAFETQFYTKIRQVYFGSEEQLDKIMVRSRGKGFDVLIMAASMASTYIKRQWIIPIDFAKIPNSKHIDARWQNAIPGTKDYIVPYLWGTYGIAYRKDLVKEEITSWKQLYQPSDALKNKIIMLEDTQETIGLGLKLLGYSINSSDPEAFTNVEKLLLAQRPFVREYTYLVVGEKSELVTGEIWMAPSYNGDALLSQEYNENIEFVIPKEGTALWLDSLVISKYSSKKELAMKFINFLHEPKNAAQLASYLYQATPNKAAEKLLPAEHLQNPFIYPSQEILEKSEFFERLSPRVRRKWNIFFSKLITQ